MTSNHPSGKFNEFKPQTNYRRQLEDVPTTAAEALRLVNGLKSELVGVGDADVEAVICPPFTALYAVSTLLQGSNIQLGAQNVHWEKEGAFHGRDRRAECLRNWPCVTRLSDTASGGSISAKLDEGVNKRAKAALANGIRPIVCVGEMLAQREAPDKQKRLCVTR